MIVGNKSDREEDREVTAEEGQEYANSLGFQFIETSAKTGNNIDKLF